MAALAIVRRRVRSLLESSPSFRALPPARRQQVAHDTVRVAAYMADPDGLVSREFRAPLLGGWPGRSAGVPTVEGRPTLQGGTTAFDAMVNAVDFPDFVGELIHGVFNAIVGASIAQMEAYAVLVSSVAASVEAFAADAIGERSARDTLAEEYPELFCRSTAKAGLAWRPHADPAARLRLQAALGVRKLDPDLRSVVAATRRRLARNRQQVLATVVLMGINRIVVSDRKVAARIRFDSPRRRNRVSA